LALVLPWAVALTLAWQEERVMARSAVARDAVAALHDIALDGVLLVREQHRRLTTTRLFVASVLADAFRALHLPLAPPRAAARAVTLATSRVALKRSLFDDEPGDATVPVSTPPKAPRAWRAGADRASDDNDAATAAVVGTPTVQSLLGDAMSPERSTPARERAASAIDADAGVPIDDADDVFDDDFVRLCFGGMHELTRAALAVRDALPLSAPPRPTKKITLTLQPTSGDSGVSAAHSEQAVRHQAQLRHWFAWQQPQLAALGETVASSVARRALAAVTHARRLRRDVVVARAVLLMRAARGDERGCSLMRACGDGVSLTRQAAAADVVRSLQTAAAARAAADVERLTARDVAAALSLLAPRDTTPAALAAAVTHAHLAAVSLVRTAAEQQASQCAVRALDDDMFAVARLGGDGGVSSDGADTRATVDVALRALTACALLWQPTRTACASTLRAAMLSPPTMPAGVRALAQGDDSTSALWRLPCATRAVDLLARALHDEPMRTDRSAYLWRPLLPRVALALGELLAHALEDADAHEQQHAQRLLLDAAHKVCDKLSLIDRALTRSMCVVLRRHSQGLWKELSQT
jgi:hypothetical protein